MSSALNSDVLVLNRDWAALRVVNAAEALADLFVGRVQAVDTDYQAYDFDSWRELSASRHRFEPQPHRFVQTVSDAVLVPAVVRLLKFDKVRPRAVRMSRRNVYLRDNYTCQYTGKKLPASELNLDHVLPVSRGGRTTWENVVCCSIKINTIKGGRTPEEAGLGLIRRPRRPDPTLLMLRVKRPRHDAWKHFVDAAYWNTELRD